MSAATSVVTPARFAQGQTYADFLAQALVNRDKFQYYYQNSPLTDADLVFFKKAAMAPGGVAYILALGEAWCGDVYRELPTVARIADESGMQLRIFLRDENPDIMDEFLTGKARAIPVFVFYDAEMRYITRFVERPASAQAEIDSILGKIKARLNLPDSATFTDLPAAEKQEVIDAILPRFHAWQRDSIDEMRRALSSALNLPNS